MISLSRCKFQFENNHHLDSIEYIKNGVTYIIMKMRPGVYYNNRFYDNEWRFNISRKYYMFDYIGKDWDKMPKKHRQIADDMLELYENTFNVINKLE